MFPNIVQKRPQIIQIEQQHALIVGDLEADAHDAFLGIVQPQQP